MSQASAVTTWESLFRAQVAVMQDLSAVFPTDEISLNEYDVLFNLSRQPDRHLRIKDINKHVLLTQPSISRLVDRLAARGLIEKSNDPDDARGINVTMTVLGFELFRSVAQAHMASIQARFAGIFTPDELTTLTGLCERLHRTTDS